MQAILTPLILLEFEVDRITDPTGLAAKVVGVRD
jgi:hypothetical protein